MKNEIMISQPSQPQIVSDNPLINMANEHNKLDICFDRFSSIAYGYYANKLQHHSVITGKNVEDRLDTIGLFVADAKENNLPIFYIHRGNYVAAGNKGAASVRFQDGGTSGYWFLERFRSSEAAEILTTLGERMLGHDKANYEFWSIVTELIGLNGEFGVRLQDLANFPCWDIDSELNKLPKTFPPNKKEEYRRRYERFRARHDISQIERICELLNIPQLRYGKCTIGGVVEKNAEMFFDLSRFTATQADILQELLCMEIEAAAKKKNRKVLLVLDDLRLLKPTESLCNRLLTQVDSHISVVLSCGDLFTACNGDIGLFNQIVSKADTDVFIFAQPSENLELWSNYFGKYRYMTVNINRTQSEANNAISKWLPGFLGEPFESLTTTETYSTNTEWQPKFSPDKLAFIQKGFALGRISSENQLYALRLRN